jgi:histone H3/H4
MAKAKKVAGKKVGKGEVLVVASKVRQFVRGKGVNMSSEVIGALNSTVQELLGKAVKRTGENKRKTLRPQDL